MAILAGGAILSACSRGRCDNANNGDANSLQIITPKTIYSTSSVNNGYVTIFNNTESPVSNLHYALISAVGSGANASINSTSAASCATLSAHTQCNLKISVPAGSIAGSFSVKASNNSTQITKLAQAAASTVPTSLPVGIEQVLYNSVPGADGITLSYYHTVINGVPYILVSGVVASSNAGSFNNIVLVDSKNNAIPNQTLISGNISSAQGASFMILLPVPSTTGTSQTIKVQTQQVASDGIVTPVSTATASSTLTTTSDVGIANMLPGAIYLTESNPEQVITFSNSGDALASLQNLVATNPNIEVIFNPISLASGAYTTATLKLKNPKASITSGAVTLNYNNGQTDTKISAVAEQNINPQYGPTPTPTPTPTPGPPPEPSAGLTIAFSPDSDFFTTTVQGTVSRQMKISNTGSTDEDSIVLALPANFSIGSGINNSCTVTQGTTPAAIIDSLPASTGSCDMTVTYTNSTITPQDSSAISITYNYNSGTAAPTPTTATVNYRVTQSTAVLSLTNPWSPYNFINIASDNTDFATQAFTLYNSGEVDATNVAGSISPASIFTILSNYGSTIASGTSRDLNLKFGPSSTLGANATTLTVNYHDYPTHAASPLTVDITGSVSNAIAYLQTVGATGFAGGNGQNSTTPYAIQTGSNGQVTLTYKNKGNEPALNFKFTSGTISSKLTGTPFTLVTDGCNLDAGGKTLAANETCDEVLQYSPTATGATTLPLNTPNWQFSYSDTHGNYTYNSAPVYFNAYAPAIIAITTTGLTAGQVPIGGNFQINAALSGGYQVPNQTIALQNLNPADANINISNTCQVSSTTNQCSINVPVGSSAVVGSYTLDVVNQTGGASITSGSPVAFSVIPGYIIFVTNGKWNGNLIRAANSATPTPITPLTNGISAADYLCSIDTNKPTNGTYKAMILAPNQRTVQPTILNWVLKANARYIRPDGTLITNSTNSVLPAPLVNPITVGPINVFTGVNNFNSWTTGRYDCNGWSSSNTYYFGSYGVSDIKIAGANFIGYGGGGEICSQNMSLYCVQQ